MKRELDDLAQIPRCGTCATCGGERWVCETHGTGWDGAPGDCCTVGPGMPCPACNDPERPAYPPGSVEIWRARGEDLN